MGTQTSCLDLIKIILLKYIFHINLLFHKYVDKNPATKKCVKGQNIGVAGILSASQTWNAGILHASYKKENNKKMIKSFNIVLILLTILCVACNNNTTKPDPVIQVSGIVLSHTQLDLELFEQIQLTATVLPPNATNQNIEWFFSDQNIVTMDLNGVITTLNYGLTIVSAKTDDGGYTAECEIYVPNNISDFAYQIIEEVTIEIVDYVGNSDRVFIPRMIDDLPVTTIGVNSFHNKSLLSAHIPEGIIMISEGAFSSNLFTSLVLPNSLRTIGPSAFSDNLLTEIFLSEGVSFIGRYAFEWNQLSRVVFPNSVTSIGTYSFSNNQLTEVIFGDGLTMILWGSFANNQLSSIDLPHSLRSMLSWVFGNNPMIRISIGNGVQLGNYIVSGDFPEVYGGVGGVFTRQSPDTLEWKRE